LVDIGRAWLRAEKPGRPPRYYDLYGFVFRDRVLAAIAKGRTNDVLYIYEVERMFGLGHIGCVTQYLHIPDYYSVIFETGWTEVNQEADTVAYLDVVDESGNRGFTSWGFNAQAPFVASRVECGLELGEGWPAHEWRHVQLTWNDGTDLRLFVDGSEARDHRRYFSPLTPWSSRWRRVDGRLQAGPLLMARASAHGGTLSPALSGADLYLGNHGTLEGLSWGDATAVPTPRYRAHGELELAVLAPPRTRLAAVGLRYSVPVGCAIHLQLHGATASAVALDVAAGVEVPVAGGERLTLSLDGSGGLGQVSPFIEGLTLVFIGVPRVIYRQERS
jgi:hypothetical protein